MLFGRGTIPEARRIAEILRLETVGGALLVGAAVLALLWANSPWSDRYQDLTEYRIGPSSLHLDLTLATWAADGLLAIFFFVAGLELKREFVAGDLRDPRRAALPVVAAVGGMVVPALIFVAIAAGTDGALRGWAVPTATDIAFALAVLAVVAPGLPAALRTFLLTLAVVDDLLAIVIIAVVYTSSLDLAALGLATIPLLAFGVAVQRGIHHPVLLLPLAVATWVLVHESGVHATVAGVLLGFAVPVSRRFGTGPDSPAEHIEHRVRPLSAGFAVPVFAFFAAGVDVGSGFADTVTSPVTLAVAIALVLGKPIGVLAAAWAMQRFTRAELADGLEWPDIAGVAVLAGIGFTVSLLIGELAYGVGTPLHEQAKVGVLLGSLLAALVAALLLRARGRRHRA
ncbi:MAG: Na+/H+ antiporter NhaA [Sporichthyaceae bacterium]